MKISPFFNDLRSAYQAEIDDLTEDSEGKDVLRKRLSQKRAEIGFLVKMMDVAPEMVAVVFHQGIRFGPGGGWDAVLSCGLDNLPDWSSVSKSVNLEAWASGLARTVLNEPGGDRFMVIAAGLEYLLQNARMGAGVRSDEDDVEQDDDADALEHDDDYDALSADDAADPQNSRSREEASANWLADVGFERKD